MYRPLVSWLAAGLLLLAAPAWASSALVVGVQPYQGARALIAEHRNLADYLRHALKRPVRMVTARNTTVFAQRLLAGEYDIALAPAHLARLAQREAGWQLVAEHQPDTPVYLFAKASAPHDKKPQAGDIVAVPDRAMLISLAAQRWFDTRLSLDARDYTLLEAGSHSAALQAVLDGRADYAVGALAALHPLRAGHLERVRIAHEIGNVPLLVYIARRDLAPATLARLRTALLKFPVPAPLRAVAPNEQKLTAMDAYLPVTRLLLRKNEEAADVR